MHKFQDFGDYQEGYYSVQTPDGEKIGQLIGGYIDIILKKKRTKDHQGIEGDEGSFLCSNLADLVDLPDLGRA